MNDEKIAEMKRSATKGLLQSLNHLTDVAQKGGNPTYVLDGLLHITQEYIEYLTLDDIDLSNTLGVKISRLTDFVKENVYQIKSNTFQNSTVIGQFIEILKANGLPRDASIEATALWLDIGISTARTHNENFRKVYSEAPNKGLNLIFYLKIMNEKLKNQDDLPSNHPNAKRAFFKTKKYYQDKIDYRDNFFKERQDSLK